MDVTILIAPRGSGRKPVKFSPKVHVVSVPDGADAEAYMDKKRKQLRDSYGCKTYVWESVRPLSDDLMDKFRRYVEVSEEVRLNSRKQKRVRPAYGRVEYAISR